MKKILVLFILFIPFVVFSRGGPFPTGGKLTSGGALNYPQDVKVVFDVNVGEAPLLLLRLNLIEKTLRQIREEGKNYLAVIAFRGGATDYITKGDKYVPANLLEIKRKIRVQLNKLALMGAVLQQCAIAAELRDVSLGDILDEVSVVKNGYISIIGFQNQGYAFVPMD